jgi:hypothetical protein
LRGSILVECVKRILQGLVHGTLIGIAFFLLSSHGFDKSTDEVSNLLFEILLHESASFGSGAESFEGLFLVFDTLLIAREEVRHTFKVAVHFRDEDS